MWRSYPTPLPVDMGQCSNPKEKQLAHSNTSTGKKRKGGSIDRVTDVIMEFTKMSRIRHNDKESGSWKTVESVSMRDPFSMDKAMTILNTIDNVNDLTLFKVLNKLHRPESRATFIMMKLERRRGWMDLVTSLL